MLPGDAPSSSSLAFLLISIAPSRLFFFFLSPLLVLFVAFLASLHLLFLRPLCNDSHD